MKILVFPNDSIISYYNKGEIKKRYFNPGNLFDEVHIVSFNNEEIPANRVADLAGKGKLFIHTLGKPKLSRLPTILKKLKTLTYHIAPSLIRCYNPHFMGAMGIYCSKGKIPVVISIHTDYSRIRRFKILKLEYLPRFFRSLIELLFFEPYVYRNANHFISVYPFATQYIKKKVKDNKISIIYNRVYLKDYENPTIPNFLVNKKRKIIISVSRHITGKNPELLIRAIKNLDVDLLLIGEGPLTNKLKKLTDELKLSKRVRFIPKVMNRDLPGYYLGSDIFALSNHYPGVAISVLEAMAASLPLVLSKPFFEPSYEICKDIAIIVDPSPKGFEEAFSLLLKNPNLRHELGRKGKERMKIYDGEIMEKKEVELYLSILKSSQREIPVRKRLTKR